MNNTQYLEKPARPASDQIMHNKSNDILNRSSIKSDIDQIMQLSEKSKNDKITYRSTEAHPDNLDYPGSSTNYRTNSSALSMETPLNNRYSEIFQLQQNVNDQLRSQLPWSYTNNLNLQPTLETRAYPEIPKPDYYG